jgi:hypothetical protein
VAELTVPMLRVPPVLPLLALLSLPACMNEYHPEYHPETVYQYVQTIKVEDPHPPPAPPAPVVVIVQSPPPPAAAPIASSRAPPPVRAARASLAHRQGDARLLAADAGAPAAPPFQAAPVFAADDRSR